MSCLVVGAQVSALSSVSILITAAGVLLAPNRLDPGLVGLGKNMVITARSATTGAAFTAAVAAATSEL